MVTPLVVTHVWLLIMAFVCTKSELFAQSLPLECRTRSYAASTSTCDTIWRRKLFKYSLQCQGHHEYTKTKTKTGRTTVFDPYEPEWTCEDEERIGDLANGRPQMYGDGAKFVCTPKMLSNASMCLVYSFGSNDDLSFERAVWRYSSHTCEIHVFDPTLAQWRASIDIKARIQFNGSFWGIGLSGTEDRVQLGNTFVPTSSLTSHMQRLGHDGRLIHILKVDIEDSEWDAFGPIFEACAKGRILLGQLMIELHAKSKLKHDRSKLAKFFKGARSCGLRLFHKERNGWSCKGWKCVEFAFVHEAVACLVFNINTGCSIPCNATW